MLRLNVASLKRVPGGFERFDVTADLPPLEFAGESIGFIGPVKAGLNVTNTGSALTVEGQVCGTIELTCGRCLERFGYPFEALIEENYAQDADGDTGDTVPLTGDFIDATPEVLKSVILVLPMKIVCREDCSGLCPRCGCKLSEGSCGCSSEDLDPRLSVLKDLLNKK